ncbi:MAG: ComEC/Rec2 family competence protein [Clostridia bacterium]|nr:ComEC/Rec2 family competence protein [Clostridia bacterium]
MKKIMNFRPALFMTVAVVLSIISAYFFIVLNNALLGALFCGLTLIFFVGVPLLIAVLGKKSLFKYGMFSLVAVALSLSAFFNFYLQIKNYNAAGIGDKYLTVSGTVDEIENFDGGAAFTIDDVLFSGVLKGEPGYKVNLFVFGETNIDVGDKITFSANVSDKALLYEGRFAADDVSNKVRYYAQVNASDITATGNRADIFQKVNVAIRNALKNSMGEEEFAVSYALLCGNSDYTGSDVLDSYRNSGVAHIFAVSGLHIGFLALVFGFILGKIKINPYVRAVIIFAILFFYSGVCGFTMSSLRATIMCGVSMLVFAGGKRYDGLSSVSISAVILSVLFPTQIFSAGFMLSFSVVYGILLLAKPISATMKFLPEKIAQAFGTVLSAQIFSIPVLICFFGEITLLATVLNLIFIPVVGAVYVLLLAGVILYAISPVFLFVQDKIIYAFNWLFKIIGNEGFVIGGFTLNLMALFYYAAFIVLSGLLNLKRITKTFLFFVFIAVFIVCSVTSTVKDAKKVKAYAIGNARISATAIVGEDGVAFIISHADKYFSAAKLGRIYRRYNKKKIVLIALSGIDVNLVTTKIYPLGEITDVYYVGTDYSEVYENSFKDVNFSVKADGDKVNFVGYTITFSENGRAAVVNSNGKRVCVFGEFGSDAADFNPQTQFDLIVAYDYLERVSALYDYKNFVSYRNSLVYKNAEREGAFYYEFD